MTFEEYWPTACLPGEYDSMDACDQGRWRGVAQAAWQAGRDSDTALLRQALEALEQISPCVKRGSITITALRERLGEVK